MDTAASQDKRRAGPAPETSEPGVEVSSRPGAVAQDRSRPTLSDLQRRVLEVLSKDHRLPLPVLRTRTGCTEAELREALDGLRDLGLVSRLNTVIESYSARFPGLRVDD